MILQKELSSFSSFCGEIILGGDFNSRLGNKDKDYILSDTLKILNGKKIGDLTGKYTCHQSNGSSVVDYIIAEPNIFDKINYFQVLPLTTYSDHCQIIANLDIKPLNPINISKKCFGKPQASFSGTAVLNKK